MAPDQLEAYQAKLAALTADCADIPPRHLERAIADWVRSSPYLPKASDLVARARSSQQGTVGDARHDRDSRENAERLAEQANIRLKGEGKFHIRWVVDEHNALKIEAA